MLFVEDGVLNIPSEISKRFYGNVILKISVVILYHHAFPKRKPEIYSDKGTALLSLCVLIGENNERQMFSVKQ